MFYNFKKENKLLEELKITPNQAWFCIMLMEQDFNKKKEIFVNYCEQHGGFNHFDILALEQLGYIENFNYGKPEGKTIIRTVKDENGKSYKKEELLHNINLLEFFIITPKFTEKVYIDPEDALEELLSNFPSWMIIDGQRQYLKNYSPKNGLSFAEFYNSITGGDILKHKYICQMFSHFKRLVAKKKVNGIGIVKALDNQLWKDIEELLELEETEKDVGESL